jgi:short-subunit dehydrogenase
MSGSSSGVAVVTGAGRGLGRLVAKRLANRGLSVVVTDIDQASAEDTAASIGSGAWPLKHDVRDAESHRRVARAAADRGPVTVWVNNAGILKTGTSWEMDAAACRQLVEVNLLGVIHGSHAAVEVMRGRGGHIINLGSMSSVSPAPGLAVYGATKHGVLGFSLSLQAELKMARLPIHVSTICPDGIDTDMVKGVAHDQGSAIIFSGGDLLSADKVADLVVGVLDSHQMVLLHPFHRGMMARLFAPFPEVGMKVLAGLKKLGERRRRTYGS